MNKLAKSEAGLRDDDDAADIRTLDMSATLEDDGAVIRIAGTPYLDILRRAHEALQPRTYFEIGSLYGDTLRLARCAAIAVDPVLQLNPEVLASNAQAHLYEKTSDDFFATHRLKTLFGRTVDFAFLDGMHEFPFLLRDFINTERNCRRSSVIVMHDCLPGDAHMTRLHSELHDDRPSAFPGWWTGDVWKIVPVLRQARPDLNIICLDAPPTGLVVVTNLNPHSRVLSRRYDALIDEWASIRLEDWGLDRLLQVADPADGEGWLQTLKPFGLSKRIGWEIAAARLRWRKPH